MPEAREIFLPPKIAQFHVGSNISREPNAGTCRTLISPTVICSTLHYNNNLIQDFGEKYITLHREPNTNDQVESHPAPLKRQLTQSKNLNNLNFFENIL